MEVLVLKVGLQSQTSWSPDGGLCFMLAERHSIQFNFIYRVSVTIKIVSRHIHRNPEPEPLTSKRKLPLEQAES